jgi:hypothetical protein
MVVTEDQDIENVESIASSSSGGISLDGHLFVAHDETRKVDLTYDELYDRAHSNDMDFVRFDSEKLTEKEQERLIVRATSALEVLRRFGAQLRSNAASKQEYDKSWPVERLDEFLSHSWQTNRWSKTLTLSYHYNFSFANAVYMLLSFVGFAICFLTDSTHRETVECQIISIVVMLLVPLIGFITVLCFGMRIRCSRGPSVFLDKLCIHQTNSNLKVLGISNLDTLVRRSDRLVLLYDSMTFERLWCAFESAMFAHDRRGDVADFEFVPVSWATFVVLMSIGFRSGIPFVAVLEVLFMAGDPLDPFNRGGATHVLKSLLVAATFIPLHIFMAYLLHRRNMDVNIVIETLSNFSMEKTKCFEERDRVLVNERIESTWGSLQKFDTFVRSDLKNAMESKIGSIYVIPYWTMLAFSLPFLPFCLWAGLNSPGHEIAFYVCAGLLITFVMNPVCLCGWVLCAAVMSSRFKRSKVLVMISLMSTITISLCFSLCHYHFNILFLMFG